MKARDYFAAALRAGEVPVVVVRHPEKGEMETPAFSALDAKGQAALFWGLDWPEVQRMQVFGRRRSG